MPNTGRKNVRLAVVSPTLNKVLRISIVCYAGKEIQLKKTLASLLVACILPLRNELLRAVDIVLVNNGPTDAERRKIEALLEFARSFAEPGVNLSILGNGSNVGFGAGHNMAFDPNTSDFHLVLNPDVELSPDALFNALEFMLSHVDCGIIAPAIYDREGNMQHLCKRYPSVFDLLIRGFAPRSLRRMFQHRLASYEMRDIVADSVVWSPPIISGCFMLLRSSLLEQIKGFDPHYFLYFEDFDLSLRASKVTRIAYVPSVQIIHYGGYAARKGLRHIFLFVRSAVTFFNSHGWKWY